MRLFVCSLVFAASTAIHAQQSQSLTIDPASSTLTWTGHAEVGAYAPSGKILVRNGQIVINHGALREATLIINMGSMTGSNDQLVHHLESPDFFDVARYPNATLRIDRVTSGVAFGTMTIKDKSAPFQTPFKVSQSADYFLVTGKAVLDRTQFGVVYNSSSVFSNLGDKAIRNTFEVEFALRGKGTLPAQYLN